MKVVDKIIKDINDETKDLGYHELNAMIAKLSKRGLNELLGHVEAVCLNWTTMRLMPNGNIGTLALYQQARDSAYKYANGKLTNGEGDKNGKDTN